MYANISNSARKAIYRRDGWRCALCDCSQSLQLHHVLPRGRDGNDTPHNLITLCSTCHAQAHGHLLADGLTQSWVEQECMEYVADIYAPDWSPWKEGREPWRRE